MSVTETSNAASVTPVAPTKLTILAALGQLGGSNERYEKFLPDLEGAYLDAEAFAALTTTALPGWTMYLDWPVADA